MKYSVFKTKPWTWTNQLLCNEIHPVRSSLDWIVTKLDTCSETFDGINNVDLSSILWPCLINLNIVFIIITIKHQIHIYIWSTGMVNAKAVRVKILVTASLWANSSSPATANPTNPFAKWLKHLSQLVKLHQFCRW